MPVLFLPLEICFKNTNKYETVEYHISDVESQIYA